MQDFNKIAYIDRGHVPDPLTYSICIWKNDAEKYKGQSI